MASSGNGVSYLWKVKRVNGICVTDLHPERGLKDRDNLLRVVLLVREEGNDISGGEESPRFFLRIR